MSLSVGVNISSDERSVGRRQSTGVSGRGCVGVCEYEGLCKCLYVFE